MPIKSPIEETAHNHGFVSVHLPHGKLFFTHPEGHALLVERWGSYAVRWADNTYETLDAGAWASYHKMTPEAYGANRLAAALKKRDVRRVCAGCGCRYLRETEPDRSKCTAPGCRCHQPGRSRKS